MMKTHLDQTLNEGVDQLTGHYAAGIREYDAIERHGRSRQPRGFVIIDSLLPKQPAGLGVERVGPANQIREHE